MSGGKKSGAARTPTIEKNTLYSYQKLKTVDLIGAGEIAGFLNGNDYPLKSIYLNDTPVQNKDGSLNHSGVSVQFTNGAIDQSYLPGFTSVDNAITVGAEVEQKVPITRTVVNPLITSVRVTVGVDALMQTTKEGDQLGATVDMSIQIIKNGTVFASQNMHLSEKGSQPFRVDFVFSKVPEAPFDIKCTRITPDSKDDMLRNKTFFFSYVESVDAKFRYPKTAVIGMELDSKQFGNNNPTRTYLLKGSIVQVPSNYNAETRTYTGLWDRLFKPAFTNNPAWVLYDLLTDEIDGFGERFKNYSIDIDKLYELSKYCDELVDDGEGGKEPRFVCNIVLFGGSAYEVIHNICSIFRGLPSFSNDKFTIYYDRKTDVSAVYNNSNVVDGVFEYSMVARTEQFNQVQVEYVDQNDGYRTKIDELSDEKHILKNGLNTQSIVAYGCTKRSYALRCAKWNLVTNLTENEYVSFKVGASGIRHELYDILKIADNDYVGVQIAGRIEKVEGSTITLDRDLSNVKNFTINVNGKTDVFTVTKSIDSKTYQVDKQVNIVDYAPFVATLNNVEPRLFRCVSITEEDDGIYAITCIKHNPQKEAMVDKGAEYIEGNYTLINPLPGLSNGIVTSEGRIIVLTWDALTVIGSVNKYTIKLYKGNDIYRNYTTSETRLELENLPQGNYTARIRAINEQGQYSDELIIAFSTTYELTGIRYEPIVFGISVFWEVPPLITTNAYTEIWWSKEDDRSTATIAAKLPYPQNNYTVTNLSIKDSRYFWLRLVDEDGNQGEFTRSLYAESSDNAQNILDYLKGKITETELGDEVVNGIIKDVVVEVGKDIEDIIQDSDIINEINQKIGDAENYYKLLALSKNTGDLAVQAMTSVLSAKVGSVEANLKLAQYVEATNIIARTRQMLSLYVEMDGNKASIEEMKETTATEIEAIAKSIEQLKVEIDGNISASLTEMKEVIADVDGNVKAMATLQLKTTVDGKEVIGGYKVGVDNDSSVFNIMADSFVLTNQQNGEVRTPFIISQNKLAFDGDMIAAGTIAGNKITANTEITAPKITGGQLNIGNGRFTVSTAGVVNIVAEVGRNRGMKITSDAISVYDENGVERVKIGKLY